MPAGHEDAEIKTQGIIVSDIFYDTFHYEKSVSLQKWLKENGVPGIAGVDTRRLTQMIRDSKKPIFGRIVPEGGNAPYNNDRFAFLKNFPRDKFVDPSKYNLLPSVSVKEPKTYKGGNKKVALLDLGVKRNIIKILRDCGCAVTVYPWDADTSKVEADAWVLSDGPGDPKQTGDAIARAASLLKSGKHVMGIGLGHQIMALAAGAKTKRMVHPHRSLNQPVFDVKTRKGFISGQNHSYEVDKKSLPPGWEVWFENANDFSVEGLKHKTKPFISTQFHPEASGSSNDTSWIVRDFVAKIRGK